MNTLAAIKTYGEWTHYSEIISHATKIKYLIRARKVFIDGKLDSIEYETQFLNFKNPFRDK